MEHQTKQISFEADTLFLQSWSEPGAEYHAVVLIVHGLGEHSGRYAEFAAYLVSQGYFVASLDLPGHGESSGQRGHINRFEQYRKAVELLTTRLKVEHEGKPIYLLGHSMGGLVSAATLLSSQNQYAGCILSGAALAAVETPGALQHAVLRVLSRLFPSLGVLALNAQDVSRDAEVVKLYSSDPLNYRGKFSARLVVELFQAMAEVHEKAATVELPLLILHGEADRMTPSAGSQKLYDSVSSEDKSLHILPSLYHEILNEPEREEVYSIIGDWLSQRRHAAAN